MVPRNRNRRLFQILLFGGILAVGLVVLVSAVKQSAQFFYNPSEVVAPGFQPASTAFQIGGLVVPGSVDKGAGTVTRFDMQDFPEGDEPVRPGIVPVVYDGVLPDLFKEGQGVVVSGQRSEGVFRADEVLAKHDENYQPKKSYSD